MPEIILVLLIICVIIVVFIVRIFKQQQKISDAEKYYCCDCDEIFYSSESIKTQVGIYPCPRCAGNNTCLDTLKKEHKQSQKDTIN